jgi:CrcB protein
VNLLGCFLIGLAVHLIFLQKLPHAVSFLVVVGFLGAFTTFSTFANENMEFLRDGAWGAAALYVLLSTVGGVALCFAGFLLGHQLHAVLK